MIILGAGMSGTLMAAINNDAIIYESQPEIPNNHSAVLRFREDKISKTLGIPFRKVKVKKSIWVEDSEVQPSPRWSNYYSKKVTGSISERSINNIDTVERFIAPSDFHLILSDICKNRIIFNSEVTSIDSHLICIGEDIADRTGIPIISTMPMSVLSKIINKPIQELFHFKNIKVSRYKVDNCDVYQTIYYPYHDTNVYRATLTGDNLIIESMITGMLEDKRTIRNNVCQSFGISIDNVTLISEKEQKYGKISPINDSIRKNFIFDATHDLCIYSIGRFACWRNILLDDVYDDIFKIKQMINKDFYELSKWRMK